MAVATPRRATSKLNEALLAEIFSYSDAPDLLHVLDTREENLIKAARLALSNATALHFSFLLQLDQCRNHGSAAKKNVRKQQEDGVRQLLLDLMVTTNHHHKSLLGLSAKLQRVEFTGLRHIVGDQGDWLTQIFQGPLSTTTLTSIDFSGCAMLDPRLVHRALVPNQDATSTPATFSSIRHVSFQGCYRIDQGVVLAIATSPRFQQLQSLRLGGCSQTIGDACVQKIMLHLRQLRYLDLSGLKHITDQATEWLLDAPEMLESLELAGCELLRFTSLANWSQAIANALFGQERVLEPTQLLSSISWTHLPDLVQECLSPQHRAPLPNLIRINLHGIGTPRRGLLAGALAFFAFRSMGALREVHLSGCEHIRDWEVQVLAMVCGNSLTCLEMRACCIGDDAVRAVGAHCTKLADVDFSACFLISDAGILSFCQSQGTWNDVSPNRCETKSHKKRAGNKIVSSTIRSLKIAALPQLTNDSVAAIAALESLIVLDVNNCPKISSDILAATVQRLPLLVEVHATGIGKWGSSVAALACCSEDNERKTLRFVNGRPIRDKSTERHKAEEGSCYSCCTVKRHSKRLNPSQGVPLQPMYHCLDCKLIPSLNRGMCHACSIHCHRVHNTFLGSFTRYYCDCAFGVAGTRTECEAMACGSSVSFEGPKTEESMLF